MHDQPDPISPAQQDPECPEGCCTGNEILCISSPCPIQIVLLGIDLELNLGCISLASTSPLSALQVQQVLQTLTGLIGGLGGSLPTED